MSFLYSQLFISSSSHSNYYDLIHCCSLDFMSVLSPLLETPATLGSSVGLVSPRSRHQDEVKWSRDVLVESVKEKRSLTLVKAVNTDFIQ